MLQPEIGRFRMNNWEQGPVDIGHGGLAAFRFCGLTGVNLSIRLHQPIPIDTELVVTESDDGFVASILGCDGPPTVILSGAERPFEHNATDPVPTAEAHSARQRTTVRAETHNAPNCMACGLGAHSMLVHPGPLGDGRYATDLTPPAWTVDDAGGVDPMVFWTALDCVAGIFVNHSDGFRRAVTAQFHVRASAKPIQPGTFSLVAFDPTEEPGWQGRKRRASSAAFDADGNLVAVANSFWISVD